MVVLGDEQFTIVKRLMFKQLILKLIDNKLTYFQCTVVDREIVQYLKLNIF